MDQAALVENQIKDGQRLLEYLDSNGLPVVSACWARASEDSRWSLYITAKAVSEKGLPAAYRALHAVLQGMNDPWLSLPDIKFIGADDAIARQVLSIQQRHVGRLPAWFVGPELGEVGIEEAYIYSPPSGPPRPHTSEQRRLKKDVEQIARPQDYLLTREEKAVINRLVAEGVSSQQAEEWVRKKREKQKPKPPIPAGTVVKAWVAAAWGERPEDDPNPLLMVEGPSGARGLTFKEDTEPVN